MKQPWVVPAVDKPDYVEYANLVANKYGLRFRMRYGRTIHQLLQELESPLLVANQQGCYYRSEHSILRYHMGLAPLRLLQLQRGKHDYLLDALSLIGHETVLDATFGFGADSYVIASALQDTHARIIGLESSAPIYYLASEGLLHYIDETGFVTKELRQKIDLFHMDHGAYLEQAGTGSVDIVYFDPMFIRPVEGSVHMEGIRNYGNKSLLHPDVVAMAKKVAKKRIVIKERRQSDFWLKHPADEYVGGKYSNIVYGVIYCES